MARDFFYGREAVLARLLKIAEADRLGQPFLFTGPEGSGKENTALEFARLLNCVGGQCGPGRLCESCVKALTFQHPDIRWIGPAPATLNEDGVARLLQKKINNPFYHPPYATSAQVRIGDPENPQPLTVRSLIHFLRRRAFQGKFKVAVVADSHRMNLAAANAFLKTLEEPPPATVIMLLTTETESMLPTIISRCQEVRFQPWPESELDSLLQLEAGADPDQAQEAARVSAGNARRAMALLQPRSRLLQQWAGHLFQWINRRQRAQAAIAADELHRGVLSHAFAGEMAKEFKIGKSEQDQAASIRRDRAIQLCEFLNLHYSDALNCRELGRDWRPRLGEASAMVRDVAAGRRTETLLEDVVRIDASRRDIDGNINIGLAMAVLFEDLIDHAEEDHARGKAQKA